MIRRASFAALLLASAACSAQSSSPPPAVPGRANLPASHELPFKVETIGTFDTPFAMALVPGGQILVTEKAGKLQYFIPGVLSYQVAGVPKVAQVDQGGLLDVIAAPDFAQSQLIYLTYSEAAATGSQLAMARAKLENLPGPAMCEPGMSVCTGGSYELQNVTVLWRSGSAGEGGQFGAVIAFAPDGKSLFLSSGERQRFTPAQDPDQALGKILHLTLDGQPWPGNPGHGKLGAATVTVTDPPKDTQVAKTLHGRTVPARRPNITPAETWSTGHRNPYGLQFDSAGRLWEIEMGPKGGDELNLILPGRNYGWPNASNATNYDGVPIPAQRAGDGYEAPKLWWNPSIAPSGLMIYSGKLFPQWRGSAFITGLAGQALVRVNLQGDRATPGDQWAMDTRLRDVIEAPDGAILLLTDEGKLLRLTPK